MAARIETMNLFVENTPLAEDAKQRLIPISNLSLTVTRLSYVRICCMKALITS